jgi:hypothetical protein
VSLGSSVHRRAGLECSCGGVVPGDCYTLGEEI